jgi:hypothetical protein
MKVLPPSALYQLLIEAGKLVPVGGLSPLPLFGHTGKREEEEEALFFCGSNETERLETEDGGLRRKK